MAELADAQDLKSCERKLSYRFDPVNLHLNDDSLAQLVEHLTFNQRVTGSSPVRVIFAGLAELADAPDLGSGA